MSKKDETKVKSLQDIKAGLEEKAQRLGRVVLKKFERVRLSDPEAIAERRQWVKDAITDFQEYITEMAEILRDPDRARRQGSEVTDGEQAILNFVKEVQWKTERADLTVATMEAMAELYPDATKCEETAGDVLRRIAEMGLALDFFVDAGPKVSELQTVRLPVMREDGRGWEQRTLTTHFPGSKGILPILREKAEKSLQARKERHELQVGNLRKGAGSSFLEVLENGGEATFLVPPQEHEGRYIPGGHLRVKVEKEKGLVYPVAAVGRFARRVQELAEQGVFIRTDQVLNARLELTQHVEHELFRGLLFFHNVCHRGFLREAKRTGGMEETDDLRARATVDPKEFLSDQEPQGTAYLFLKRWTVGRGIYGTEHSNVAFLCERNEAGEIRVADCRKEHEELFKNSREFKPEDELGYPLKQMMKIIQDKIGNGNGNGNSNRDSDARGGVNAK